jgi:hypothetical protein
VHGDALLRNVRHRHVQVARRGERVEHHLQILILKVERDALPRRVRPARGWPDLAAALRHHRLRERHRHRAEYESSSNNRH